MTIARFQLVALDCADPHALAAFYATITGRQVEQPDWVAEEDAGDRWVQLGGGEGPTLAFQRVDDHAAPTWPGGDRPAQLHLDFLVDDLDEAERVVLAAGARRADHQAGPDLFRVYLDPAGHPFCLVLDVS